jgi:hypothetical protein
MTLPPPTTPQQQHEACFGYRPLAPYEIPMTLPPPTTPQQQREKYNTFTFV